MLHESPAILQWNLRVWSQEKFNAAAEFAEKTTEWLPDCS